MNKLLLIILLISFGQQAQAGFTTGSEVLEWCEAFVNKTDAAKGNVCSGYVMGIADAHEYFTNFHTKQGKLPI
jgi:hypothetical protein